MITTKGAARFHSYALGAIHASATSTTTASHQAVGGMQMQSTAPNPNSMGGLKRLASCREELERSWQGTGERHELRHCVSSDGGSSDDAFESQSRVKRRRTFHHQVSNTDDMMMECSSSQVKVRGNRISPDNRPPRAQATTSRKQVKAGWYEGEVDVMGNRHGHGTTKHDDGTEYSGPYVNDIMEGPVGKYKFVTTCHHVPNPCHNGSHLHRQVEKTFEGSFKSDVPHGAGMIVTKTVDCAPQVLGSTPVDVRFAEVAYDIGMHNHQKEGKAVGEGLRVIYSTSNAEGRSSLEMQCFRLDGGNLTCVKVAPGYAAWMVQCMGVDFPEPPSSVSTCPMR